MSGNWVTALSKGALADGEVLGVTIGERDIAIYRLDGAFYATEDECTHARARLSDGWLEDGCIVCPIHAGRFDVRTGRGMGPPIPRDVRTYPTRVVGDEVQVDLAAE